MNNRTINSPAIRTLINKSNLVGAEIGVGTGINALNMLETLDIKKLYLIDPYHECNKDKEKKKHIKKSSNSFYKDKARDIITIYNDKIVWIYDISFAAIHQIKDEELDFVYIDGNHAYEYVKQDAILYRNKVKVGGLIAGHDFNNLEVERAVREVINEKETLNFDTSETRPHTCWWYTKV